jgi:ATP-dependent RNA helicase DDX10/DBP4
MDAIIGNLPSERQTLLFSATQTKNVDDLARVSLKNPIIVLAYENSDKATPDQLTQVINLYYVYKNNLIKNTF